MSLASDKIQKNWEDLIGCIKQIFKEDYPDSTRERLLKMYHDLESRMMLAPASGRNYYHNCFPGGYVDHVLRVINSANQIYELWKSNGANVDNYTEEEVIFVAMHHDLGKVGDLENDYYTPNESEWHRKNQGKIYTTNPKLQYMNISDRSLWLLQEFNIKLNQTEYIGLKLADGLYDEGNKSYYMSFNPDFELQTNLAYIIHQADMIASKTERDKWKYQTEENKVTITKPTNDIKEQKQVDNLKQKFDELFAS